MQSLKSLLQDYSRKIHAAPAGADEYRDAATPPVAAFNRDAFHAELQALRKSSMWTILSITAMVVVLAVVIGFLIDRYIGQPPVVTSLFIGFGTVAAAMTTVIMSLFKIKAQSDFLDILSRNLDGQTVQTIVDILSKRL